MRLCIRAEGTARSHLLGPASAGTSPLRIGKRDARRNPRRSRWPPGADPRSRSARDARERWRARYSQPSTAVDRGGDIAWRGYGRRSARCPRRPARPRARLPRAIELLDDLLVGPTHDSNEDIHDLGHVHGADGHGMSGHRGATPRPRPRQARRATGPRRPAHRGRSPPWRASLAGDAFLLTGARPCCVARGPRPGERSDRGTDGIRWDGAQDQRVASVFHRETRRAPSPPDLRGIETWPPLEIDACFMMATSRAMAPTSAKPAVLG